jgi:hypothetical protein
VPRSHSERGPERREFQVDRISEHEAPRV